MTPLKDEWSIWIDAPHFCAGVVLKNGTVEQAPPILKYMKGWTQHKVENYCISKRWNYEILGA